MNKPSILLAIITVGMVYIGLVKIALITGIATAFTFYSTTKSKGTTQASSSNVNVQPIKVKRKYDGPDSIYPEEMEIKTPPKPMTKDWTKNVLDSLGSALGSTTKKITRKGGDDDE